MRTARRCVACKRRKIVAVARISTVFESKERGDASAAAFVFQGKRSGVQRQSIMRVFNLAALYLFRLLKRRTVIYNVNGEIADRRQNRCLYRYVPAVIRGNGRFALALGGKGDRRSAGQNIPSQDVERDGQPLIRQGDIISPAIQGGYHHALRWGSQRVKNQQVAFLSAGGGQGFHHQVPQAMAQLFGLFQTMQNVAVGGIAIAAAN